MRHRKKVVDKNVPSRPLVCAVLGMGSIQVYWVQTPWRILHCSVRVQSL